MNIAVLLGSYLAYRLNCMTRSPDCKVVQQIFGNIRDYQSTGYDLHIPELYRKGLYTNRMPLDPNTWGAGSRSGHKKNTIAGMTRTVSVNARVGRLIFHLAKYLRPPVILELGTALGLSTMYLALGYPDAKVLTVEGNTQMAEMAGNSFKQYGLHNITLINRSFDEAIPELISRLPDNYMAFIDGNHSMDCTLQYYRWFASAPATTCTLVFDDIRWSAGMMKAWKIMQENETEGLMVDLFHQGIIFRGRGCRGQKIRLRY
jgi:predicted O-methyltransferase YrrM